jgi:hypothetical protein
MKHSALEVRVCPAAKRIWSSTRLSSKAEKVSTAH